MARKVFISSVIKGFTDERAAARRAVETLRLTPVMAEEFGARPTSPQVACLEGVRKSDIYVGVFGERYGKRAESGMSPTEEEFREAEKRGLEILCFVSKGKLDADQTAFIDSIKGYEGGKLFAYYDSADELKDLITTGLNDISLDAAGMELTALAARQRFEHFFVRRNAYGQGDPELRAAIVPARQFDEYFSPSRLSSEAWRDEIAQQLLFGPNPRLFDKRFGIRHTDGEDFVRFWQGENEDDSRATVTISSEACTVLRYSLSEPRDKASYSFFSHYVVDESKVRDGLTGFYGFCERLCSSLDSSGPISSLYTWTQVASIRDKYFGMLPRRNINSMSMPGHSIDDPVCIPAEPQSIARKQLRESADTAQNVVRRLVRKFKAAGAYYTPTEA